MGDSFSDLRPEGTSCYEENREFLQEKMAEPGNSAVEDYFRELEPRIFNHLFSRDNLVGLNPDTAVIDSEVVEEVLEGLSDIPKEKKSLSETPQYKQKTFMMKSEFERGYKQVRGLSRPPKIREKLFRVPKEVEKSGFSPEEVEGVLEGEKDITETEQYQEREQDGFLSRENLLYVGSPDQLAGALITAAAVQDWIFLTRSLSVSTITAGVISGAYIAYSAADIKSSYDEGIKKGVEDELHELGSWMKMETLEGKKVKIETGDVPDANNVKLGGEPYFKS